MSADSVTFSDPAFEKAMMLLEADYKVFFVEGKSDQNLFLKLYQNVPSIWFAIPSGEPSKCGRDAVEKIVSQLEAQYPDSLYGICDRDFDSIIEDSEQLPKIFYSDFHDIVMDAFSYSAFLTNYLENSVSATKQETQNFTKEQALRISKDYATIIGSLRLLSINEQMNLSFTSYKVKIPRYLNDDLSPNAEQIIDAFLRSDTKNQPYLANSDELLRKVIECREQNRGEELHLIQGHDFFKIFSQFFNKIQLGRRSKKTSVDFEDMILTGYQREEFSRSKLSAIIEDVL